jgi:2-polyprenyl-6-methoxyphenol hydroxylase-like FAD-dependent oxidoreductase
MPKVPKEPTRILVAGGGYVGMYTALRPRKKPEHELKIASEGRHRFRLPGPASPPRAPARMSVPSSTLDM